MLNKIKRLQCKLLGHKLLQHSRMEGQQCSRCGYYKPTRAELLRELMPAISALFDKEFKQYGRASKV